MAATDKPYRNQYRLDVVFGASCVLLLLSVGWMMYDDHYRPWKRVQRTFRDVEEAMSLQQMLAKAPDEQGVADFDKARDQVEKARKAVDDEKKGLPDRIREAEQVRSGQSPPEPIDADAWLKKQGLEKARLEAKYQDTKATFDSIVSLYNIAVDDRDNAPAGSHKDKLAKEAEARKSEASKLDDQLKKTQEELEKNERATTYVLANQKKAEGRLTDAEDALRKKTGEFDRLAKTAAQKRWKKGDWFRSLPIIDGFASAYKIQQVALDDLTIEYGSFKYVPRYDRCTTCHLAIDRASFDPAALRALKLSPERQKELQDKHDAAVKFLKGRAEKAEKLGFDPSDLSGTIPSLELTDAQVKQYCAHPRLDLFVGSNSAHPYQAFGCTSCHAGQGSATEFNYAAHSPNDVAQRMQWEKEHGWEPSHDWEFPMLPARFVESACLKCHHQVTDLISQGSKEEAPKLLKGYNLVRESGCFGCHEISGLKAGKDVGPDLRLEPSPPLDDLRPDEVAKLLSDPSNPPGTMRKIGPALRRVSEKVDEAWLRKWINEPRGFRPDTRMPHFYNVSNNTPDVLPADPNNPDSNQKDFPAVEVASIAHYLFTESTRYVNHGDTYLLLQMDREKELLQLQADHQISDKERIELVEVQRRIELAGDPRKAKRIKVADTILDADRKPIPKDQVPQPGGDKDRDEGRRLFTERGCLACHSHSGTEKAGGGVGAVAGRADFGPNLSRLAAKLNGEKGRRWLLQWLLNPNVHSPRTRMPNVHLTPKEAGQVADWLLNQSVPKDEAFNEWNKDQPEPSKETLVDLARVYLKKAPNVNPLEVDTVLANGFTRERLTDPQNPQRIAAEADEQVLEGPINNDKLKYYIGKKAVSRLGCYACHDIPGFESAKPIGTPLNDWGKKDPARLAFEDISAYVKEHFEVAKLRDDPADRTKPDESWVKAVGTGRRPYEQFFADALNAHLREGFLHQKLMAPRSYDFNRDVKWDDRLRMPQFKFAHSRQEKDESDEDFKARAEKEEAEGREAVMTFILGLVAEPIHPRYLNNPKPDRLAEVKGRQVIDKFNCAGCHLIRPGVYEFKLDDADGGSRSLLDDAYKVVAKDKFATDHVFPNDNAWAASQPLGADRLTIQGANPHPLNSQAASGENVLAVRLTEAAQWESRERAEGDRLIAFGAKGKAPRDGYRETLVLPAANDVRIDPASLTSRADPFGGTFADLMVPYLVKKDVDKYKNEDGARGALPPPLVREGQKVQTEWLYNFLRNPTPIRPFTVGSAHGQAGQPDIVGGLRMPKFNMSADDARAIVNYFAAADKTGNPGIGLTYPYSTVPQRDEVYWQDQARHYWERSGQVKGLHARVKKLQDDLIPAAKKRVDAAMDDVSKKQAQGAVVNLEAKLKVLNDLAGRPNDAAKSLYWADAYSLLATTGRSACLTCHSVGAVPAGEEQGPPLELAYARLRPGWTAHWLANPKRLLTYDTAMPQNFPNGQEDFQELFPGSSLEQIQAARDVLMNLPKVADLPENRSYRQATTGGK
jgi:mono/diheme cytochrome c family protein